VIILVIPDEAKPSSDNNLHGCAKLTGDSYDATQSCVTYVYDSLALDITIFCRNIVTTIRPSFRSYST